MFTQKEIDYLLTLLLMSEDSLKDLTNWKEQELMTPEEIDMEYRLIYKIREKLINENCNQ